MIDEINVQDIRKKLVKIEDGGFAVADMHFTKHLFTSSEDYKSDWKKIIYEITNPKFGFPPMLIVATKQNLPFELEYPQLSRLLRELSGGDSHCAATTSVIVCSLHSLERLFDVRKTPIVRYSVNRYQSGESRTYVTNAPSLADYKTLKDRSIEQRPGDGITVSGDQVIFAGVALTKQNAVELFTAMLNTEPVGSKLEIFGALYPQIVADQSSDPSEEDVSDYLNRLSVDMAQVLQTLTSTTNDKENS